VTRTLQVDELRIADGVRRSGQGRVPSVHCLNGKQGTELAEVIVEKIKSAVNTTVHKSSNTVT
jgi:hypothetical protein